MASAVPHPIVRSLAADGPMLPTLVDGPVLRATRGIPLTR
jgi:hypothetical protein